MRVAHIITRLILGGAQENTLLTVEGLQRCGDVKVALVTGPALGPEGDLFGRAEANGVNVVLVPEMRRSICPWRDAITFWKLVRFCQRFRPDVVHTHSAKAGILGRAAARVAGVPVVVHTIHGSMSQRTGARADRLFLAAERLAGRWTTAFVSVADAMTEQAVAAGVAPPERFRTILSGMEVERYLKPTVDRAAMRKRLGFDDSDVVICKVGRLFHMKGHEYLVEAAADVVRQCPEAKFLLVGDGVLREQIEAQVERLGLSGRFVLAGLVPADAVTDYLHASDVVVHTSLREGLARVLPQGLIAGRPVVSYDVDGAREVALPNRTGFLVPPESVTELAEALVRLVRDPSLRERLGRAGCEMCATAFRHERMVARIRELYEECLRTRRMGGPDRPLSGRRSRKRSVESV